MSNDQQNLNQQSNPTTSKNEFLDIIKTVFWAVVIVLLFRTFLFEPFNIPSGSMIPTLLNGDYIFVSKYNYGYSHYSFPFSPNVFEGRIWSATPKRGDVVVFRFTKNTSIDYIKRVVGLPGDHVQVKDSILYINEQPIKRIPQGSYSISVYNYERQASETNIGNRFDEYFPETTNGSGETPHQILQTTTRGYANNTIEYVVPQGYFFAMGDNRDNSSDSRFNEGDLDLGFVPMENLVGEAQFIFYSYDHQYSVWQFWHWPDQIRWNRLFKGIK